VTGWIERFVRRSVTDSASERAENTVLAAPRSTGGRSPRPLYVVVVAVEREDRAEPITPHGGTHIEAGDRLTVYSGDGVTPEVTELFGHDAVD
jgi:Trk K+ transport system NAD-binding subunit